MLEKLMPVDGELFQFTSFASLRYVLFIKLASKMNQIKVHFVETICKEK